MQIMVNFCETGARRLVAVGAFVREAEARLTLIARQQRFCVQE